jgi:hypothetical protein
LTKINEPPITRCAINTKKGTRFSPLCILLLRQFLEKQGDLLMSTEPVHNPGDNVFKEPLRRWFLSPFC